MTGLLDPVYRAVESGDLAALGACMSRDVFMLTPEATGVLTSREAVTTYGREHLPAHPGISIDVVSSLSGTDDSGRGAWVFDQIDVRTGRDVEPPTRVRVTALLLSEADRWSVAACYWSTPYDTQDEQDAVKHAGDLQPGLSLPESVPTDVRPLSDALTGALAAPREVPTLYSERDDHATIGSVIDEVFVGPAGREAWQEFVGFVSDFAVRGPMRGALVTPSLAWLAANLDIGQPPTPYRFFYGWLREPGGWRIVISHDGVSRPLPSARE